MSTKQLRHRIDSIQRAIAPPRTGNTFTLAELMRYLWDNDRAGFMQLTKEGFTPARILMPAFEREDRQVQSRRGGR